MDEVVAEMEKPGSSKSFLPTSIPSPTSSSTTIRKKKRLREDALDVIETIVEKMLKAQEESEQSYEDGRDAGDGREKAKGRWNFK